MPGVQVQCPHCRSVLESAAPLAAGTQVRFRNCKGAFAVYPAPAAVPVAPPAAAPAPRKADGRALALAALALGGLLCLGVGTGVAVYCLRGGRGGTPAKGPGGGNGPADFGDARKLSDNWVTAAAPKPLGAPATKGLAWLAAHQQADGGWGSEDLGGPVFTFGPPGGEVLLTNKSSVADTSIAALALLRAGSTPHKGTHADQLRKAVEFVCGKVEAADTNSLGVTDQRGTLIQSKLGPHVDTFLALWFLAEVKGLDPQADARVTAAIDKVVSKMARNQDGTGSWEQTGAWAPVLGQAVAAKAVHRARQAGAAVPAAVLDNARKHARKGFDPNLGTFDLAGSANVPLYAVAGSIGALQDSVNTDLFLQKSVLTLGAAEGKLQAAQFTATSKTHEAAVRAALDRIKDPTFLKGFGKNGGEEFLSYVNIGEALAAQGGPEWQRWDKTLQDLLSRVQNQDGSWSGRHCVSGRTFCTAAALLAIMADRSPVPPAATSPR